MSKLLVATANPGKLHELDAALSKTGIEVVGLDALDPPPAPVEETGSSFEENARLKAEAYSRHTPLSVLADDSGLEVDALEGAPGIHSARYGGPGLDDPGRCRLLLDSLHAVPDPQRTARFRCVLAVARAGRTIAAFNGSVEGRITHAPRGMNGFGYDPVFFHEGAGRTFAELRRDEKQGLSHRGQAVAKLVEAVRSGRLVLDAER